MFLLLPPLWCCGWDSNPLPAGLSWLCLTHWRYWRGTRLEEEGQDVSPVCLCQNRCIATNGSLIPAPSFLELPAPTQSNLCFNRSTSCPTSPPLYSDDIYLTAPLPSTPQTQVSCCLWEVIWAPLQFSSSGFTVLCNQIKLPLFEILNVAFHFPTQPE